MREYPYPFLTILVYNIGIMSSDLPSQIHNELGDLGPDAQQRVLEFLHTLKRPGKGMSADALKEHIGRIDAKDGQDMRDAVESGCEQINIDE